MKSFITLLYYIPILFNIFQNKSLSLFFEHYLYIPSAISNYYYAFRNAYRNEPATSWQSFLIYWIVIAVLLGIMKYARSNKSEQSQENTPWKFPSFDKSEQFQDNIEEDPRIQKLLEQLDKMKEETAVEYIEAHCQDHPEIILFKLGYIKYKKENYRSAFYLFDKATIKGHKYSKYIKGLLFFNGQGVDKDLKEAYTCFNQTSATVPESKYMLGRMYQEGLYVEKNLATAYYYYNNAAKEGNREAITRRQEMLVLSEKSS